MVTTCEQANAWCLKSTNSHPQLFACSPFMTMEGHVQHGGVVLKDMLRAISVVDVPVQDDDSSGPCGLGCLGCDSRVVEEAEAHGHATLGMVACNREEMSQHCVNG